MKNHPFIPFKYDGITCPPGRDCFWNVEFFDDFGKIKSETKCENLIFEKNSTMPFECNLIGFGDGGATLFSQKIKILKVEPLT